MNRILALLAGVLVFKVALSVTVGYGDYFPPNFQADFLLGREKYFWGPYQAAFYTHILFGPLSLLLGLLLVGESFRRRYPGWHRSVGKAQAAIVLLGVAPSGLWMAYYAQTGPVAAVGFSVLAILTTLCIVQGWRSAVARRMAEHRRWMSRCFLLLCSAVVIRLIGGLVEVTGIGVDFAYPLAAWISWLVPLAAFELRGRAVQRHNRDSQLAARSIINRMVIAGNRN